MKPLLAWAVVCTIALWMEYREFDWWMEISISLVVGIALATVLRMGETDERKRSKERFGYNTLLGAVVVGLIGIAHTILS